MLEPVKYTEGEQAIISVFEARLHLDAHSWTDASLTSIKSSIKKHYVVAQGHTCCYCRHIIPVDHGLTWGTEHVVPRSSHPQFMFTPLNLAVSCHDCNGHKSSKQTLVDPGCAEYPSAGESFHVVHPHFDEYDAHITRSGNVYTPISDKGSWTITECNLMRFTQMKLGWPTQITDDRFDDQVSALVDGDLTEVHKIRSTLDDALTGSAN